MKIIDVHVFKIPDFLIEAIHHGDITDFTDHDESILKTANEAFKELCDEDEQYIVAMPKKGQEAYHCKTPDFTKHSCKVYDLLVTVFK